MLIFFTDLIILPYYSGIPPWHCGNYLSVSEEILNMDKCHKNKKELKYNKAQQNYVQFLWDIWKIFS